VCSECGPLADGFFNSFIHFVERLYDSTMQPPHGHFDERESPSKNQLPVS
jgi:hypothetical protein